MPTHPLESIKILASAGILAAFSVPAVKSQTTRFPFPTETPDNYRQFILPQDGPNAAASNPALIAETEVFDVSAGLFRSVAGKGSYTAYSGSISLTHGFYAGMQWYGNGSIREDAISVYIESTRAYAFAYGWENIFGSD